MAYEQITIPEEVSSMVRNKEKGFPPRMKFDGEPNAQGEFSPKRADLSINTTPKQRMRRSNEEHGEE